MKRVLVFGTFDLLHPGHKDFLRQAKKLGGHLMVVVGRDKTVFLGKGYLAQEPEKVRLAKVQNLAEVDQAFLGHPVKSLTDQVKIIQEIRPDVICLGYDQKPPAGELKTLLRRQGLGKIEVKTLKPFQPEKYKSSRLRGPL